MRSNKVNQKRRNLHKSFPNRSPSLNTDISTIVTFITKKEIEARRRPIQSDVSVMDQIVIESRRNDNTEIVRTILTCQTDVKVWVCLIVRP